MTPPGQNNRNAAHSGPAFLPWHRYFLLRLELFLQSALEDENFRLPYWDFSVDAGLVDPSSSALWEESLLGRFENASLWPVRISMSPSSGNLERVSRGLRRRLGESGFLPSTEAVRSAVRDHDHYDAPPFNTASLTGFRNVLEGWTGPARIHNNVHVWVGGDMQLSSSPNDPVFFLHHCNIDRIWASWQEAHPDAPYIPGSDASDALAFHRLEDALYTIFNERVTIDDMLHYRTYYDYDRLVAEEEV